MKGGKELKSAPEITEKAWTQQIKDLAKAFNWRVYHPFLSIHSEKGFPDLVLVRERVVYAELKRESGKLTPNQDEWLRALAFAGQEVYTWKPSQWEKIVRILQARGRIAETESKLEANYATHL